MFIQDFFNGDANREALYHCFSVLHERYFQDQWKEATDLMQELFDLEFETRYVVMDDTTGLPYSSQVVFHNQQAAEQCRTILERDNLSIAVLFIDK